MTSKEALDKLLRSYLRYYDVNKEKPIEPFTSFALFESREQGYFLLKKAKISDSETREFVYFYDAEHIDLETVLRLEALAWEDGMKRVVPHPSHRNSDVIVAFIGEKIDPDAMAAIKKLRHYKSYKFTLQGWSNFSAIALDLSSGELSYNRFGARLKKVFKSIIK